jgi:hypothetical protein
MVSFGDLLDRLDKIVTQHGLDDVSQARMFSICDLTTIVSTMVQESYGDTSQTEFIQDEIYAEFSDAVASDILEELIEIHCNGNHPAAIAYLAQIMRHDDGIMLESVTPIREDDTMIYTFVRCYDD